MTKIMFFVMIDKLSPDKWIEIVKLIATFVIGLITALFLDSCTASMSVFWKNSNSKQDLQQKTNTSIDSTKITTNFPKL